MTTGSVVDSLPGRLRCPYAVGQPGASILVVAARAFMQKGGRTAGVPLFVALTMLGREVGDDLGIHAAIEQATEAGV